MSSGLVDLGFCPRCKDAIQPRHANGYISRVVDGVLFCWLCAGRLEVDEYARRRYVEWAKQEAHL